MPLRISFLLTILQFALIWLLVQGANDRYPAVFNFGDENSDTGGLAAGMGVPQFRPNGQTFFGKPSGRYCDGRLLIDFLVKAWGLPFLSPYMDSVGAPSFKHGCNFATGGSTVLPTQAISVSPFTFAIQIEQFIRFKARVMQLLDSNVTGLVPGKDYFGQGLYTIDIGQNDLGFAMLGNRLDASMPIILAELENGVKKLYAEGARKFWVHSAGPLGCLPRAIATFGGNRLMFDALGCVKMPNEAAKKFNLQLRTVCATLKKQFRDVNVTYIDLFTIKYDLISKYSQYGFKQRIAACCGIRGKPLNFDNRIRCGQTMNLDNRIVTAVGCKNSTEYINWDGELFTDAANSLVSSHVLTGKYSSLFKLTSSEKT